MLFPRHTRTERVGVVVSIISLLAVVIGTIAIAPDAFVEGVPTPRVVFNQVPGAEYRACIKQVTAEQAKSPEDAYPADPRGMTPEEICGAGLDGTDAVPRPRSPTEYAQAYLGNIATTVASSADLSVGERLLYWGVRSLIVGLFLMYLFQVTIGRILRFIWHGSPRA